MAFGLIRKREGGGKKVVNYVLGNWTVERAVEKGSIGALVFVRTEVLGA